MKYYSELTKVNYDTVDELEAAEKSFNEAKLAKELKEQELKSKRAADAKEIENKYQAVLEARKAYNQTCTEYQKLLSKFCNTYGFYHTTFDSTRISDLINLMFNI